MLHCRMLSDHLLQISNLETNKENGISLKGFMWVSDPRILSILGRYDKV